MGRKRARRGPRIAPASAMCTLRISKMYEDVQSQSIAGRLACGHAEDLCREEVKEDTQTVQDMARMRHTDVDR